MVKLLVSLQAVCWSAKSPFSQYTSALGTAFSQSTQTARGRSGEASAEAVCRHLVKYFFEFLVVVPRDVLVWSSVFSSGSVGVLLSA